jgi:serine/threonine-protein kinase ATR
MLAWRNANMPGVPVWVTEWGWDAYRPGETCGASTECVSQLAQAAYGIRGLSLMARKGVAQAHWFFYASEWLTRLCDCA